MNYKIDSREVQAVTVGRKINFTLSPMDFPYANFSYQNYIESEKYFQNYLSMASNI